jgi:hypothetical protein
MLRAPQRVVCLLGLDIKPMRPMKKARFDANRLNAALRCTARSKRSGKRCRGPAVRGKQVCRMHGGAAGSGAPTGKRNGNYRHGARSAEAIALLRRINYWGRLLKKISR